MKEQAAWNEARTQKGEPPLGIGIGLNDGPAVMGDVGSEHTLAITVIGDTVNIASRLQVLTRELKTPLVVADPVLKQIGAGQTPDPAMLPEPLQDGGERELRGRSAPIRIWTGADSFRPQAPQRYSRCYLNAPLSIRHVGARGI